MILNNLDDARPHLKKKTIEDLEKHRLWFTRLRYVQY
jgi:hypothetical protein